jgi:hypothetical protein
LQTETLIQVIAIPSIMAILSFGAAFQRIKQLEKRMDAQNDYSERLTRLETKIDLLINNNKINKQ